MPNVNIYVSSFLNFIFNSLLFLTRSVGLVARFPSVPTPKIAQHQAGATRA
uniref:Uncharacterized protein n=1 Tax=Anguilla anguilla TaxID=7936 RepID=A0A0E9P673_ANGAN